MTLISKLNRLNVLLNHDLSPMPLLTVFLGYWLPLDWMLRGRALLNNLGPLEMIQAIGSSVLLNFVPAAMTLAILVYLGSLLSFTVGKSYQWMVRLGMATTANFMVLIITAMAIKLIIIGESGAPVWMKVLVLISAALFTLWLTNRGLFLVNYLVIPRFAAVIGVPLAVGFLTLELLNRSKPMQKAGVVSPSNELPRPPDIIMVTLDALSSRHLSCYGYTRSTSPCLDAFAQDAILFESFYANSNWTRPGIASLLNGARPWTHAGDLGRPFQYVCKNQHLLGCLARAGYDIRTVSTNVFADHIFQGTPIVCAEQTLVGVRSFSYFNFPRVLPSSMIGCCMGPLLYLRSVLPWQSSSTDRISYPLARAEEMLERSPRDRPSFFWLHLYPPHEPYAAPEPFLGRFEPSLMARSALTSSPKGGFTAGGDPERQRILEGRYDEGILSVDSAVGQLLNWLKTHKRFDRSLVVVSADHGESFSHGYGGHGGPLLTEDLIRVPLIIKPPGHKGAERVSGLFEQADLAPTILHYAGLPIPAGMEGQPYPLKPDGMPVFAMNRNLSSSKHTFSLAMRQGHWKYVTHFGPWVHPWPQRELYDLDQDPNENTNLVDRKPDIAGPMHQRILDELTKRGLKPEAP